MCTFALSCPVIHKSSSWVIVFFIIGQLLFATSYSPLISLASTYLQENVEKYSLALYLAWMQGAYSSQVVYFHKSVRLTCGVRVQWGL